MWDDFTQGHLPRAGTHMRVAQGRDCTEEKPWPNFMRTRSVVFLSPQALDSSICCAIATSLWYQMWPQEFIWGSPLTKLPCWVKSGFPEPHRRRIKDHIHDPRGLVSLPSWDSKHTIFHVSSLISYWLKKSDMFLRITSSLKKPWQNSSSGIIRLLLSFSLSLPYA